MNFGLLIVIDNFSFKTSIVVMLIYAFTGRWVAGSMKTDTNVYVSGNWGISDIT